MLVLLIGFLLIIAFHNLMVCLIWDRVVEISSKNFLSQFHLLDQVSSLLERFLCFIFLFIYAILDNFHCDAGYLWHGMKFMTRGQLCLFRHLKACNIYCFSAILYQKIWYAGPHIGSLFDLHIFNRLQLYNVSKSAADLQFGNVWLF